MTIKSAGRLGGCPFAILMDPDTGIEEKYLCLECKAESEPDRDAFLQVRAQRCPRTKGKGSPPTPAPDAKKDAEALPDGYTLGDNADGGYYHLFAPDGTEIKGPSNGKWQGKDAAALAAHEHASKE